ncbi:MAG: hypothetical protein Kapaf2KO_14890 [Candidatus Kapaibacteriales bacterium]
MHHVKNTLLSTALNLLDNMKTPIVFILFVITIAPTLAQTSDVTNSSQKVYPDSVKPQIDLYMISIGADTLRKESIADLGLHPLRSSDTLTIYFRPLGIDSIDSSDVIYNVTLETSTGNNLTMITNKSNVKYPNLSENAYRFSVIAQLLDKSIITPRRYLEFYVDDSEAMLLDSISTLRVLAGLDNRSEKDDSSSIYGYDKISLLLGILLGILLIGILYLILIKLFKSRKSKRMTAQDVFNSREYQLLLLQKEKVELELKQLRNQISGMESRSEQIRIQNRDLEKQITSITRHRDELEELQQQKDDLFAVIIHDIKNPVGIIKNLVELLKSYDLSAADQNEVIDDILKTTQTIVSLSHEVSKVLALEGGKMSMNFVPQNISVLIQEVFDRNTPKAKQKNIEMELRLEEELPEISYDSMKIYEVADNLISNAVKFTQPGGSIRVSTYREGDNAIIEVADNGLGLSKEDLKNAFQKGSQLSARPTAGESSTGLGLWIVKKLVEAHMGSVSVKSTLGQGSKFYVRLPIYDKDRKSIIEM